MARPDKNSALDTVLETGIDVIVVGGCANGTLLHNVRPDAQLFELRRPEHIKPLATSLQTNPEVAHEKDEYEMHPISLRNTKETGSHIFGIAVIKGQSLTWAFSQLVIGFVANVTNEMLAAGLIQKQ